jgi:hypothetical protein
MKFKITRERLQQIILEEYKDLHKHGLLTSSSKNTEDSYELDESELRKMLNPLITTKL